MIINGNIVTDRTLAPFAARLHEGQSSLPTGIIVERDRFFCTGSLVTTRRVLTAGHCLTSLLPQNILKVNVYLGDLKATPKDEVGEVMITASNWRVHPEFLRIADYDFDLGVLFLDAAATLSPQVQLISLPPSSTYTVGNEGVEVTAYGWGRYILGQLGDCTHCLHTTNFALWLLCKSFKVMCLIIQSIKNQATTPHQYSIVTYLYIVK